jgi:hypothetical protein
MARTRQPLESLKLKGQYRADRHCGIVGDGIAPEPPDDLTPEARAEWARIIPGLGRLGVLASVDRGGLVEWCEAWSSCVRVTGCRAASNAGRRFGCPSRLAFETLTANLS